MPKTHIVLLIAAIGTAAAAAGPATVLPAERAARCPRGEGAALLVRVSGFKARSGTVRVQSYGGDPARFFDKGTYLKRVETTVPASGALDVCVPVPGPGTYAVSVRHDLNGSGHADRQDGGGMSGNPHVTLFDMLFKRKPDPARVAVHVGNGVRVVPVTLNYLDGGTLKPVAAG